ncbi:MAG: DUF1573 domain-containing protein [Rhodothermaceae bacterium]
MTKKLLLIFLFLGFIFAQDQPVATFNKTNHNFGNVKEGKFVVCEYVLENTGKSDLLIEKVKASCGCTAVAPQKTRLKPGEITSLKVEFNTFRREGKQRKFVYVFTNDPKQPQTRLSFTANILKKTEEEMKNEKVALIKIEKNYFDIGKVKKGEKRAVKVPIKNVGKEALVIRAVKSTCSCLSAELTSKRFEPGESGFINLELDTTDYIGKMSRTVTIISNDPYNTYKAVSVYVNIVK